MTRLSLISISLILTAVVLFTACKSSEYVSSPRQVPNTQSNQGHDHYQELEFIKYSTGHIVIPMFVNKVRGDFLIDTGAGRSVIGESKMDKFHLDTFKTSDVIAIPGSANVAIMRSLNNTVRIGQSALSKCNLDVMPLKHVNLIFLQQGMVPVDGIIGADVLDQLGAKIDYANSTISIKINR